MKKIGLLVLVALAMVACNAEKAAKQELENFTNRMVARSANWNSADWDDAVLYYNEIYSTVNQYSYSTEDRQAIDSMIIICQEYIKGRAKKTRSESADVEHRIHR